MILLRKIFKATGVYFISLFIYSSTYAQTSELRQFITSPGTAFREWDIKNEKAIKEFYEVLGYRSAWTGDLCQDNKKYLLTLLRHAGDFGLREEDYQWDFMRLYCDSAGSLTIPDRIGVEIRLTDAALSFFHDIAFGNTVPPLSYSGLEYHPSCISIPWQMAKHIEHECIDGLVEVLQPNMQEIKLILHDLRRLRKRFSDTSFAEQKIISPKVTTGNKPLVRKLYDLGVMDSVNGSLTDKILVQRVKAAQQLFGLLDDGVLRSTSLQELNIPIAVRIKQLSLSVNYYRWMYCLSRQEPIVVVNIPAAYLRVYQEGKSFLEMRMIVGKPATPTPTLSSRITEVIIYPYWTVPYSIATKELLPSIKRNRGFIDAGNYQVLNKNGKIMDPDAIDWASLSGSNFPYTIRQSTGCDNALGVLKLNFYNPFSVYLHDTPSKSLFMLNKRFFSHGCMRLGNPLELGHLVLGNNGLAIDTLTESCLINQQPTVIPVANSLPVVVWYNPAGINENGKLVYYEDIYKKFRW
jgi:murein L,D-transpeptidase YcbB/YkuD